MPALQKYIVPSTTPSRQVFDIVLKSGSISAAELFAKAKDLKAAEGEASVRSKTFDFPTAFSHLKFFDSELFMVLAVLSTSSLIK